MAYKYPHSFEFISTSHLTALAGSAQKFVPNFSPMTVIFISIDLGVEGRGNGMYK